MKKRNSMDISFQLSMSKEVNIIFDKWYSGLPRIRNHFFGYSLLFSNNSLLFYPLFYMKIEICFLYKGVSYSREPAVMDCLVKVCLCWY